MTQPEIPDVLTGSLVAAVDDSPAAREALRFADELAEQSGRPLHVVTAWNFITGTAPEQDQDTPPSEAAWQAQAEAELEALLSEELGERRSALGSATAVHGNPVPVLLRVSKVAQHLVIGSRGRGGFAGLLLGSTSEQLVRHAECPVTVVRHGAGDA